MHSDEGRTAEAVRDYERAMSIDPSWSVPFYNLGLLYKYEGKWELSLEKNRRAVELDPGDSAAWWNLGIAATALARWDVARLAWKGAGIDVPGGDGPVGYPCGRACVRLNPDTAGEVVWARRIDPVRAVIESIPLPESGFRFGDVVLHDGAATGRRRTNGGGEVAVFNCLRLMEASKFHTWLCDVELNAQASTTSTSALDALVALAEERRLCVEDFSTGIVTLCKACSEGLPHDAHEPAPVEAPTRRRIAIAAREENEARRLLEDWMAIAPGSRASNLEMGLDAG